MVKGLFKVIKPKEPKWKPEDNADLVAAHKELG